MDMKHVSLALLAGLSLSAVAQTKVCIGGDLDNLSQAQIAACQMKSSGVQAAARSMGVRSDWHIIVVCDDAGWSDYASFTGKSVAAVMETDEQTDLPTRTTFVRGSKLEINQKHAMERLLASAMEQMPADARPAVARPRRQSSGELLATVTPRDDSRPKQ